MAVRRSGLMNKLSEVSNRAPIAHRRGWVACQSYLLDEPDGTRIEDAALAGSRCCPERATWRVTYRGTSTASGEAALRMKCDECAQSAADCFGPDTVALRRL